ncbi:hypothetical protein [Variovorax sp. J22R115]|uniref:hypothetical protein n=1 Tax=Variovorax sp. J22R115 TaxID=3053509 RepID=UPI0025759B89|nr:hypothetical protein [Variovorax sp. J22R115]MDM0049021.1 hypothetical protein [Variovorax sp. J22R115]
MIKQLSRSLARPFWTKVRPRIVELIDNSVNNAVSSRELNRETELGELRKSFENLSEQVRVQQNAHEALRDAVQYHRRVLFKPQPDLEMLSADEPFMQYANCQASDFYHPRYAQLAKIINHRPNLHRKQWEWIFILHKLIDSGIVTSGARGLVFGVGVEPLPAVFASMGAQIVATDAPPDLDGSQGWAATNQYGHSIDALLFPDIVPNERFRQLVTHQACDMNNIDLALRDFDFNWSSCCFEHLGSLEAGIQFVINAVEKTLKIGGVAVHTTEFNASSNEDTITDGPTVIYRRSDIEELVRRLRERGHIVEDFNIGPTAHHLDFHVDVPPYHQDNVHLKLLLSGYVATSVGLTIRRGR